MSENWSRGRWGGDGGDRCRASKPPVSISTTVTSSCSVRNLLVAWCCSTGWQLACSRPAEACCSKRPCSRPMLGLAHSVLLEYRGLCVKGNRLDRTWARIRLALFHAPPRRSDAPTSVPGLRIAGPVGKPGADEGCLEFWCSPVSPRDGLVNKFRAVLQRIAHSSPGDVRLRSSNQSIRK